MNEKYINDLYSQLGGEEVFGKYEDFVNLITNDDSYIKDFHGNFGEETLGSVEDFTNLVKKKDETTELVSPQEEVVTTSDTEEVETKARGLIAPVFGAKQTEKLIEAIRELEQVQKARDLRPLLATT